MEERSVAGRLLDLDVIDEDRKPVKRTAVGAELDGVYCATGRRRSAVP